MPLEYALQFRGLNPDPGPWKFPRTIQLRPLASLGIADFPKQQAKRSKKRSYFFNLMVAGESGLGKTTFLNTLFNAPLTENVTPENLGATSTVHVTPSKFGIMT
jgi:septin family protein